VEIHPYVIDKAQHLIDYCHSKGIRIAAFKCLAPLTDFPGGPVDPVVKDIAELIGLTEDQVLLKWAHQVTHGGIVLTGSASAERLTGQVKAFEEMGDLSESQVRAISEAGMKKHQRVFVSRPPRCTQRVLVMRDVLLRYREIGWTSKHPAV
jgi:diketogulonate reductase-like aldo/keto reductase